MTALISGNKTAISNMDKEEMLAETLVKVHSSDNLLVEAKKCKDNNLAMNPGVNIKKSTTTNDLDIPFNLYELRRAISKTRQSSPGKDNISYSMLAHLEDCVLTVVLSLYKQN